MKTRYQKNSHRNAQKTNVRRFNELSKDEQERKVLSLITNSEYHMDEKAIRIELHLSEREAKDLSRTLNNLRRDGKISKKGARYFSNVEPEIVIGKYSRSKGKAVVTTNDPVPKVIEVEGKSMYYPLDGDEVMVNITGKVDPDKEVYTGTIVTVSTRNKKEYVGVLKEINGKLFAVPEDRKIGRMIKIQKPKNDISALINKAVLITITDYPKPPKYAMGKIKEVIGGMDEAGMDMLALIREYKLPNEFPKMVLDAANQIPEEIDPSDIVNRHDLRDQVVFTIDGEDAKDLDDAVSVSRTDHGTYMLYVHIADVSHYVKEDSVLDKEAVERGTSVYMMDRVIPMLPKRLSNGICSLNHDVDRYTLSAEMEINKEGRVINSNIYKAVINVNERMSYNLITAILEGKDAAVLERYSKYINDFKLMAELAKILQTRREKDGCLRINSPEPKITLNETGHAIDVEPYNTNFSNKIIEEFMLTANETVAEKFNFLKAPFIYRVHESPDKNKVIALNKTLWNIGYKVKLSKGDDNVSAKSFNDVLLKVEGKDEQFVVSKLLLRTMNVATYESENTGHFGIASKCYCHFTSPIRRYADLFVHRVISAYLANDLKIDAKHKAKLQNDATVYAKNSTDKSIRAQKVEWDSEDVKKAEYMADHIGEKYTGIISSVTPFGVYVQLDNTVEGLVRFEDFGGKDFYEYDDEKKTIIGRESKEVFKLGDKMNIKVKSADKITREINFAKDLEEQQ